MNDDDLLGYFEIHSRTERALFNKEQVTRLYALAGRGVPPWFPEDQDWLTVRHPVADPLVREARLRIQVSTLQNQVTLLRVALEGMKLKHLPSCAAVQKIEMPCTCGAKGTNDPIDAVLEETR